MGLHTIETGPVIQTVTLGTRNSLIMLTARTRMTLSRKAAFVRHKGLFSALALDHTESLSWSEGQLQRRNEAWNFTHEPAFVIQNQRICLL
jgi:hypothetical protein